MSMKPRYISAMETQNGFSLENPACPKNCRRLVISELSESYLYVLITWCPANLRKQFDYIHT